MQLESGRERLGAQEAQAMRNAGNDAARLNLARNQAVAGMSAPQLVQTGSTGTQQGTTIQSESPLATVAKIGASAAPMSL
jgi:hypothetical protein